MRLPVPFLFVQPFHYQKVSLLLVILFVINLIDIDGYDYKVCMPNTFVHLSAVTVVYCYWVTLIIIINFM